MRSTHARRPLGRSPHSGTDQAGRARGARWGEGWVMSLTDKAIEDIRELIRDWCPASGLEAPTGAGPGRPTGAVPQPRPRSGQGAGRRPGSGGPAGRRHLCDQPAAEPAPGGARRRRGTATGRFGRAAGPHGGTATPGTDGHGPGRHPDLRRPAGRGEAAPGRHAGGPRRRRTAQRPRRRLPPRRRLGHGQRESSHPPGRGSPAAPCAPVSGAVWSTTGPRAAHSPSTRPSSMPWPPVTPPSARPPPCCT